MEENIKQCWQGARFNNADSDPNINRRMTALQSLAQRYRRFSILGMVFAVVIPFTLLNMMRVFDGNGELRILMVVILAAAYFMICSVMDYWLYLGVRSIDLATMNVAEVCRKAYYYRKKHFQFIAVLLPMAIVMIGLLTWIISDNIYTLCGLAFGALLGVGVGLRELLSFLDDYRRITRE